MNENIAKKLESIHKRDGELTPTVVVKEARPKTSVLHPCFEWRDQIAGEQYRLMQARTLIRTVRIEIEGEPCNAYVHTVTEDDRPVYRAVAEVVKDVDLFENALDELHIKLRGISRSINELERLRPGALRTAAKHLAAASKAVDRVKSKAA